MFIRNFSSIPSDLVVLVDANAKRYLESMSYCPISYNDKTNTWAFKKTEDILNIVEEMEKNNLEKYFYCYSYNLKEFIVENGIKPIMSSVHDKTKKKFWVFENSKYITECLDLWRLRKNNL